ncbi:alpha/beta hydrolase [Streptomyces sp. ISL-36]|uniref:alpha/beta fold hydrolase n=1 Tax=Streptomyces sp. ISL-36 TaxID=2819182 RepID=UPI001BEC678E|nr:alpha/beta hydrolase [Streptomyces sp. ISL-36]MBT2438603.1 alpha/beta hydrolase [Streptomyces sp. ISL-36]
MRELFLTDAQAHIRWIEMPGEGPVRVFLHGLGCTGASDFAHIATHSALPGGSALLVDLLGFGLSDRPRGFSYRTAAQADAVARILEHRRLTGVELVGHSMGGAVAVRLAAARPDLVARLVVAEPNLYPGGGMFSSPVAAQDEDVFVREGFARMLASLDRPDYVARLRLADPLAVHRSAVALVEGASPAEGELLAGLDRPRAFLVGEYSLPDADTERVRALGVPVFEVPKAGHNLMIDNPDGFTEALTRALAVERR